VVLDQKQQRIRWRMAYTEQAGWCSLFSTAFLHPREQVAGGPILPRWLIERVELLDRDLGAQCSQA
jgi:hypothetical protein